MSTILYAWELGGGYGHTAAFLPIARALKERGHRVMFALRDLQYAETLLGSDDFEYLQAPVRWPHAGAVPPARSYPEILRNSGFAESGELYCQAKAWRTLFRALEPSLIVFDHAPTAVLAARESGIPQVSFGTGFFNPPATSPLPNLRPWQPVSDRELSKTEGQVLANINLALQRLALRPLMNVADLQRLDEEFITAFPELDHYSQRQAANYTGPAFLDTDGANPSWPAVGSAKLFAYLAPHYKGLETLLAQLRASPWSVLVHIPATTPAFIEKHSSGNLHISAQPLNIAAVAENCQAAICHGGVATVSAFLLRGKPLLILPNHLEQLITARNVENLGAGRFITAETQKPNFKAALTDLLAQPKYQHAAQAFAAKYADYSPARQAAGIAERCDTLIKQSYINGNS